MQSSSETLGTLLLVRIEGDERVVAHIRAELRSTAWRAIEIGPDPRLEQARLADLAASQSATAAMRVHPERAQVELWVTRANPPGGTLELLDAQGSSDEHVLALRATEALRARGLRLERVEEPKPAAAPERPAASQSVPADPSAKPATASTEPATATKRPATATAKPASAQVDADGSARTPDAASSVEPTPEETEPDEPPAPVIATRLGLELAPAVVFSPGKLGPALDSWLGLRLRIGRYFSLSGFALVPLWSEPLHGAEGSARILTLIPGTAADFELNQRRWQFRVGAGEGSVISFMHGTVMNAPAQSPLRSGNDIVTTFALLARASLRFALGSGWGVYAGATLGTTLHVVSIRFKTAELKTHEVGRWGHPFVITSLGIELPLLLEHP